MALTEFTVQEWFTELESGLEFRRHFGNEPQWHKLEELFYHGNQINRISSTNLIASNGDALTSSLTVNNPVFTLKPRRQESVITAPVVQTIDNMLVEDLNMREEVERMVLGGYLNGVGLLKLGFDSEFGYAPELDILEGEAGMTLSAFGKNFRRIEWGDTEPGMPWVSFVAAQDFVVPWGTKNLRSAPWCAHRVVRHVDEVKADPKYSKTRGLKPVMSMKDHAKSYQTHIKPYRMGDPFPSMKGGLASRTGEGRQEFCELWEIHDRMTGKLYVIATGHDKFLREDIDYMQIDGLPFVDLTFTPRIRNFWVTPPAWYIYTAQHELADIDLVASKNRRGSTPKFAYLEDMISPEELDKALSDKVGVGVKIRNTSDVRAAMLPFQLGGNNQQLYIDAEQVRRSAREISGFSRNQVGEYDASGRRTATEAMVVDRSSQMRLSRRELAVRDAYITTMRKINAIIFEYWQEPRTVQIVGDVGTEEWIQASGTQLKGEYNYEVGFSDEGTITQASRRQQALNVYMIMSQDPSVDQIALRQYLARAFNDPELNLIFRPEILQNDNLSASVSQLSNTLGAIQPSQGVSGVQGGSQNAQQRPQSQPASRGGSVGQRPSQT